MPSFDPEGGIGKRRMKGLMDFAKEWWEFVPRMISEESLGIDFKPNHLVLTLLRRSFARINLVDYEINPIPAETQKEDRESQIINLVNTFISKHQIKRERVCAAIPREKVIARFIRLPFAVKK